MTLWRFGMRLAGPANWSELLRNDSSHHWPRIWLLVAKPGESTQRRLRNGLDHWRERSQIVIVEGIGGLMSPVGEEEYVADLVLEFGYPLVVVARNALGAINQTLQTLIVAATFRDGLPVAGIVLNRTAPAENDLSIDSNRDELARLRRSAGDRRSRTGSG